MALPGLRQVVLPIPPSGSAFERPVNSQDQECEIIDGGLKGREQDVSGKPGFPTTVIVVAPQWLKAALSVLLLAVPDIQLVAHVTDVSALAFIEIDKPPDLVVLYADIRDDVAREQVRQLKALWPGACCLVLVDLVRQGVALQQVGADEVLLKGASARQLSEAIRRLSSNR